MNLLQAIDDPALFKPWFKDRETWKAWTAFVGALFALPLDEEQARIYRQCTGRSELPTEPAKEGWLICGRRAGKSFVLALIAVYLACFRDYRAYLAPGERATALVIAADRKQARVIFRYIRALLKNVPMLAPMIERETSDAFDLTGSVTIEVGTASYRSTRGYTFCAVLADELAFFPSDEATEPDYAILNAIRPGMLTIPGAMLLCASSPYAQRGALFDAFKKWFGQSVPQLVWRAPTRVMNPTVPQSEIDAAYEKDPADAAAEYGAEFRNDLEDFITRAAIDACVRPGLREVPPARVHHYVGYVDPSGGASDSFTMAIAHREGAQGSETVILDLVREAKPPFSNEAIVSEFCETLKRYRVSRVLGDNYAGEWPKEQFRKHGIDYRPADLHASDLYRHLLPLVMSRSVDLLDNERMVMQLVSLKRSTTVGRKDNISHKRGAHDDIANAVAGAVVYAQKEAATSSKPRNWPQRRPAFADPLADFR